MKHVFTPNSPLKNKTSRASARQFQTLLTVQKRGSRLLRIFGFFGIIFACVFLSLSLGYLSLNSAENQTKMILFNYIDTSGSIKNNTIAYYDESSQNFKLYHMDFVPQYSGEESQNTATKESLYFRVLLSQIISIPATDSEESSQLNEATELSRKKLEKSLWLNLRNSAPTTFYQKSFRDTVWWWWQVKTASKSDLEEKSFSDLEKWLSYPLQRDIQITTQPCSIAVVNTTPTTGVATDIGSILERSGFFVARLTNNRSDTANSLLLTKGVPECDGVAQLLTVLTPNSSKIVVDEAAALRYRARVVLLVGNDIVPPLPEVSE